MTEVERLALNAFAAFRGALDGDGDLMEQHSPGALDDELFRWQVDYEARKAPKKGSAKARWHRAYGEYLNGPAHRAMEDSGAPLSTHRRSGAGTAAPCGERPGGVQ